MEVDTVNYSAPDIAVFYLVYYDEGYTGNHSFLGIDTLGGPHDKPFADRWYTWSEKDFLG